MGWKLVTHILDKFWSKIGIGLVNESAVSRSDLSSVLLVQRTSLIVDVLFVLPASPRLLLLLLMTTMVIMCTTMLLLITMKQWCGEMMMLIHSGMVEMCTMVTVEPAWSRQGMQQLHRRRNITTSSAWLTTSTEWHVGRTPAEKSTCHSSSSASTSRYPSFVFCLILFFWFSFSVLVFEVGTWNMSSKSKRLARFYRR